MEGLEDYCLHEHPLIYNDDQQEDWCCNACGLPLLLSPSYRCSNDDCNFFLHEACKQLPQEFEYVARNGVKYSISLALKPPNEAWSCDVCGECCKNLIAYRATQWSHKIKVLRNQEVDIGIVYVDALCAPFPLEIKSKHDSHEHELVAMRKKAQLLCDVCERPQKGFFFSCREYSCYFWIHKDCAVLPRVIETTIHGHPLLFSYFLYGAVFETNRKHTAQCLVCRKKFSCTAAYYCQLCLDVVHLDCAISKMKDSGYDTPVQLPLLEEADKTLFIYKMLDKKRIGEKSNYKYEKSSIAKYHNHPLIFHDIADGDSSSSPLCDACILPINSHPYYGCEKPECDFSLHQHCANLPSAIRDEDTLEKKDLFSLFACLFGRHLCNGFRYHSDVVKVWITDLECSSSPRTIKHRLHHTQHSLHRIFYFFSENNLQKSSPFGCCSDERDSSNFGYVYNCGSCNFKIHSECALLPAKVSHKFDKHPLLLSSGTDVNGEYSFCEICEGHVNTKYWFYHCKECEQLFHVNCIPSIGLLSKIKFGGNFVIPCHREDHPVTLTRMLEIGNQRCQRCERVIEGFVDVMTFQCLECCYWFHFHCALPEMAQKLSLDC